MKKFIFVFVFFAVLFSAYYLTANESSEVISEEEKVPEKGIKSCCDLAHK